MFEGDIFEGGYSAVRFPLNNGHCMYSKLMLWRGPRKARKVLKESEEAQLTDTFRRRGCCG